jgi:hypothetical protein
MFYRGSLSRFGQDLKKVYLERRDRCFTVESVSVDTLQFLVLCMFCISWSVYAAMSWGPYRGVNAGELSETDVRDIAATGANVIRLS